MGCSGSKESAATSGAGGAGGTSAATNGGGSAPAALGDVVLNMGGDKSQGFEAKYKLSKELGSGSFSTVREGLHKPTGDRYAVKCIRRADLPPEDEEALMMEVQVLRDMDHPNIVKLIDFFQEKHFYYLVMEQMKGGELFDRIVQKQFYNEKDARDVLKVLLEAIKYCHDRNIVHRDLKPENLLLVSSEDDSTIKVADFGFARPVEGEGMRTQCGTPGYVAPEILKGETYGLEVDLWSIGVIMYILLGGYPPFHDDNQAKLYQKIKKGKVVFHAQYWEQVSDEAKDLIRKMLTLNPKERVTAAEALQHPWIMGDDAKLETHNLGLQLEQLKLFNARRKFKSAIQSIVMAQRLRKLTEAIDGAAKAEAELLKAEEAVAAA